ncbi:yrdC domain-containing protein, mitochondrial [Drosophila grimshawi]|uniref:Threonylcarbamoyl-AMP synthase n=1 Tax=Drosophila grimshawi TaxID=7222 RepID=B4J957_DROGR|nr:yrdC domain-containing protein, mitochondrial [Drosophila grimshawi]EDW02432.1 GH19895 [Drosophila grimshawi]
MRHLTTLLLRRTKSSCRNMKNQKEQSHSTPVYAVDALNALKLAEQCLQLGKVIALPTDTVYGLACDANNEEAIQRLYEIKGRDAHKPVAICVNTIGALRRYGQASHLSDELLTRLLPGPLTIVIERTPQLSNRFLNPSTTRIGIRIPDFKFMRDLCGTWHEQPLALTSANRSSAPSSLHISEFQALWPQLGAVFDAGRIGLSEERRLASTVIDLVTPGCYDIVRSGVALKQTLAVLHEFGYVAKSQLGPI